MVWWEYELEYDNETNDDWLGCESKGQVQIISLKQHGK
jgi:hypothetical protein